MKEILEVVLTNGDLTNCSGDKTVKYLSNILKLILTLNYNRYLKPLDNEKKEKKA